MDNSGVMHEIPDAEQQVLFTDAYMEYSHELRRRAHSMLSDREMCEDIVQDVFVRMWMYMMRGGKIDKVRAFLHHVLVNLVFDSYRKRKTSSLESLLERGYEPSIDDTERWFNVIDGRTALKMINRLPRSYKEVLRNTYARNLSYGEISSMTGLSRNTIAVQVHRGLVKLKSLIA